MILAAALLAAALPDAPPPEPTPPVWRGVWQGTVGALPVRLCLDRRGETEGVGSYYYLSKRRAIRLEQQGGSREWTEGFATSSGPPAPRWRFETIDAAVLAGIWRDGSRTLAFRMTRMPGAIGDAPCSGLLFNAPRLQPLRVTTARAVKDGVGYTRLTFDVGPAFTEIGLQSFALVGDTPATRRINTGCAATCRSRRGAVPGSNASRASSPRLASTAIMTRRSSRFC